MAMSGKMLGQGSVMQALNVRLGCHLGSHHFSFWRALEVLPGSAGQLNTKDPWGRIQACLKCSLSHMLAATSLFTFLQTRELIS